MLLDQWSVLFDRNVLLDGADWWEMQPVDGSVKTLWSHQPTATPPPLWMGLYASSPHTTWPPRFFN